eukprot:6469933-Amphidinium_carterae.1
MWSTHRIRATAMTIRCCSDFQYNMFPHAIKHVTSFTATLEDALQHDTSGFLCTQSYRQHYRLEILRGLSATYLLQSTHTSCHT